MMGLSVDQQIVSYHIRNFGSVKVLLILTDSITLTIIPEQPERIPIGISFIMGLSADICSVAVIVTDVLDLFEICFENLDISIDERAIIFFLTEIEPCVIGGSYFG
jgi:hypothetical protein